MQVTLCLKREALLVENVRDILGSKLPAVILVHLIRVAQTQQQKKTKCTHDHKHMQFVETITIAKPTLIQ